MSFGSSSMDRPQRDDSPRGEVAQSLPSQRIRTIRFKGFSAASADELAAAIRAWAIATEDGGASLNSERELIDIQYDVEGGEHHALLLWTV